MTKIFRVSNYTRLIRSHISGNTSLHNISTTHDSISLSHSICIYISTLSSFVPFFSLCKKKDFEDLSNDGCTVFGRKKTSVTFRWLLCVRDVSTREKEEGLLFFRGDCLFLCFGFDVQCTLCKRYFSGRNKNNLLLCGNFLKKMPRRLYVME